MSPATVVRLTAAGLMSIALGAAVTSLWHDAIVIDEVAHITSGYSYLRTGSLRLNPEHPPLVKEIAALPLLRLDLKDTALRARFRDVAVDDQWRQGRMFLFGSGNDPVRISRAARLPMLLFYVGAAALIFFWAQARYGLGPGLLAFVLFVFSPTVLAQARYVLTDVPASGAILAAVLAFFAARRRASAWTATLAALALGVALLVKYSAVLLLPYLLLIGTLHGAIRPGGLAGALRGLVQAAGVIFLAVLLVVWPFYEAHLVRQAPRRQREMTQEMLDSTIGDGPAARRVLWASDKPLLRPVAQYVAGVLHVVKRTSAHSPLYFLGTLRAHGTPWYFPLLYLVKEPLAWWLLVGAVGAAVIVVARRAGPRLDRDLLDRRFEEIAMAAWIALYGFMCMRSKLNVGVRHLLPIFPFAVVLLVAAVRYLLDHLGPRWRRRAAWTIGLLAAAHALSTLSVHPSYLAFYNTLAGGPEGGRRIAVDSNLDWGQDLLRLSAWTQERGLDKIEVHYLGGGNVDHTFGPRAAKPREYGSEEEFRAGNRAGGWIAVSITVLQTTLAGPERSRYDWLATHPPVAVIGHSIAVWHLAPR